LSISPGCSRLSSTVVGRRQRQTFGWWYHLPPLRASLSACVQGNHDPAAADCVLSAGQRVRRRMPVLSEKIRRGFIGMALILNARRFDAPTQVGEPCVGPRGAVQKTKLVGVVEFAP
jgi:hypothetical protein